MADLDSANRAVLQREIGKLEREATELSRTNPNDTRSRQQTDWQSKGKAGRDRWKTHRLAQHRETV
ncbi:hypothetical protein [Amycolatopsis sp. NPDC059657]|uniref:hypothetical protein n=1 Tax=Amycolatopsis sp. NPDC059657 TaxID=3346899 RepID=UPI003672C000